MRKIWGKIINWLAKLSDTGIDDTIDSPSIQDGEEYIERARQQLLDAEDHDEEVRSRVSRLRSIRMRNDFAEGFRAAYMDWKE